MYDKVLSQGGYSYYEAWPKPNLSVLLALSCSSLSCYNDLIWCYMLLCFVIYLHRSQHVTYNFHYKGVFNAAMSKSNLLPHYGGLVLNSVDGNKFYARVDEQFGLKKEEKLHIHAVRHRGSTAVRISPSLFMMNTNLLYDAYGLLAGTKFRPVCLSKTEPLHGHVAQL